MKTETVKYSLSDIIDAILAFGGFGFVISILMIMPHGGLIAMKGVLLLLASTLIGSTGLSRFLLRKKQRKIEELEGGENPSLFSSNKNGLVQTSFASTKEADLEVRFLEALTLQKGRITLTEAVILVREAVDKLLPIIQNLQHKGIIGSEVSDNGQIIYVNG